MSEHSLQYLWKLRHDTLYRAELSKLYHRKREKFFDAADRLGKFVTVVAGAAAVATLVGDQWRAVLAAIASLAGALSLVFGISERARRHADLASQHGQLIADIVGVGERDFTEDDIKRWCAKLALIEAGEPKTLSALTRQCQNELAVARDQPDMVFPLPWHERLFIQVLSFDVNQPLRKS